MAPAIGLYMDDWPRLAILRQRRIVSQAETEVAAWHRKVAFVPVIPKAQAGPFLFGSLQGKRLHDHRLSTLVLGSRLDGRPQVGLAKQQSPVIQRDTRAHQAAPHLLSIMRQGHFALPCCRSTVGQEGNRYGFAGQGEIGVMADGVQLPFA